MSHRRSRRPWWARRIYYCYYRLLRLSAQPAHVSRGIAAGVFSGCFPLFGFQTILGVIFAIVIRGNRIAAAAATWISNPLTYVPIYAFNFQVGEWLLHLKDIDIEMAPIDWTSSHALAELGGKFVLTLATGCLVTGLVLSLVSYGVSYTLLVRLHRTSRLRRLRNWRQRHPRSRYKKRVKFTR